MWIRIRICNTDLIPYYQVESSCLKFLTSPPLGWDFAQAVSRFNANVSYSGLLHAVTQAGFADPDPFSFQLLDPDPYSD
jgi:hypothetical protein